MCHPTAAPLGGKSGEAFTVAGASGDSRCRTVPAAGHCCWSMRRLRCRIGRPHGILSHSTAGGRRPTMSIKTRATIEDLGHAGL